MYEWKRFKLGTYVEGVHVAKMNRDEWLALRRSVDGIGGSELGAIMGIDSYKSRKRLFYEKLGVWPADYTDNRYAQRGRFFEDQIGKIWEFHDGTNRESTVLNEARGYKPRKCQNLFFMIRNPEYPGVFANVDKHLIRSPNHKGRGILEIKSMSSLVGDKYAAGYPPKYILQLSLYLLLTGYEYGEVAVWVTDRDYMMVIPVWADKGFQLDIYSECADFMRRLWECQVRLEKAKLRRQDEIMQLVMEYEPDDTPSLDLTQFYSETYKLIEDRSEVAATPELINHAEAYDDAQRRLKQAEEDKVYHKAKIQEEMRRNMAWRAEWHNGSVSWKQRLSIRVQK